MKAFLFFVVRWILMFGGLTLISIGCAYIGWQILSNLLMVVVFIVAPIHPLVRLWVWTTKDNDEDDKRRNYRVWFLGNMNERS